MSSALIVGAGVFGAALADRLVSEGFEVTLVDRFEPGDPRSESGGETRLLRYAHGPDDFYSASVRRARATWVELGVLVECGMVWLARREDGWEADSERVLRAQGLPVERLEPGEAERLFPSLAVGDLAFGLLEPEAGVLRAGDGVRALVARAREGGLRLERGEAQPDGDRALRRRPGARGRPRRLGLRGLARGAVRRPRRPARDAPARRPVRRRAGVGDDARLARLRREPLRPRPDRAVRDEGRLRPRG